MRVEGLLGQAQIHTLQGLVRSSSRHTNANSDLLTHTTPLQPGASPAFSELSDTISPFLTDFGFLLFGENLNWFIKEMWMNLSSRGGHQSIHSHANSFVSGIVYLSEVEDTSRTVFHRDMGGRDFDFSNGHEQSETTPYNADRWVANDVQCGDMVLYPSYLLHAVPPNQGEERMTLAFNALPDRLKSWDYEVRFSSPGTENPVTE